VTGLLQRTVNAVADRLDRRNFLGKAAVVGSAVVAAPLEFGLKPKSAYAAICNCSGSACACGSQCCDGYTEFCCTLTGVNTCPPGTITAGWWKVDGSAHCGGAARYYIDCNTTCGPCPCGPDGICSGACAGYGCGCAGGDCNNRKTGCTRFRYGQCNQHLACVGPIVCRVVSCAAPWTFDPACGTSSRTDEATRFHDRPCLNEPIGSLDYIADVGGAIRVAGWAVANSDFSTAGIRVFLDTGYVHHGVADLPRSDVKAAYPQASANTGYDATIGATAGKHLVCVWGVDRRTGRDRLLGFKELEVKGPFGAVDLIQDVGGGVRVVGWTLANASNAAGSIRVYVDSTLAYHGNTDRPRPDVAAAFPGAPELTGYDVTVGAPPGKRTICVWGVDRSNGSISLLAARDLVVSEPPPQPPPPAPPGP